MAVFGMDDKDELNNSTEEGSKGSNIGTYDIFEAIAESNDPTVGSANNNDNGEHFAGGPFHDF